MRIKKIVLMAIRGNTDLRRELKRVLDISEPTLYRIINDEKDDTLTKAAALKVIREGLDLTDDEILDSSENCVPFPGSITLSND